MGKKEKAQKKIQDEEEKMPYGIGPTVGVFVLLAVIIGGIVAGLDFVATSHPYTGNLLTLVSAGVAAVCWRKKRASVGTLVVACVIMAICIFLWMSFFINGFGFFGNDAMVTGLEDGGLASIGLSSGNEIIDLFREFFIHASYSTKYNLPGNISIWGPAFLLISGFFYYKLFRFLLNHARD